MERKVKPMANFLALLLPFGLLLGLTLIARRPLWQSAILSYGLALPLWLQVPGVGGGILLNASLKAALLSLEIGLILVGAIAYMAYLDSSGATRSIQLALSRFSAGWPMAEALLLAWLLCSFLEGAAGFGAPAALLAPLLLSLGYSPLQSAVAPLLGDSAAVIFGAVGTPIRVGLAGVRSLEAGVYGSGINLLAGLVGPLSIAMLLRGREVSRRDLQLAAAAGLCFTLPAFALAWTGPEFPSLGGALIGITLFCLGLRWRTAGPVFVPLLQLLSAFAPYLLLCLLLLLGKFRLEGLNWQFTLFGSSQPISLFQPGLVFLASLLVLALLRRDCSPSKITSLLVSSGRRLPGVGAAIFGLAGMAQLVIQAADLSPFTQALGAGWILLLMAPTLGAVGAFVSGSATVSCLLFGPILDPLAEQLHLNPGLVLGLLLVGSGAGNMVSLQNLVAVQATVGLRDQERPMLELLAKPCLLYIVIATGIGLALYLFSSQTDVRGGVAPRTAVGNREIARLQGLIRFGRAERDGSGPKAFSLPEAPW